MGLNFRFLLSCFLRVHVDDNKVYTFSYSFDGVDFKPIGSKFTATTGVWIGAKVGLFSINPNINESKSYADFDWIKVE